MIRGYDEISCSGLINNCILAKENYCYKHIHKYEACRQAMNYILYANLTQKTKSKKLGNRNKNVIIFDNDQS